MDLTILRLRFYGLPMLIRFNNYLSPFFVPVISISQSHICLSHLVLTTHRYTVEEEVGAFDTPAYYCRQLAPYLHMARKQEGGWPPYNSRERFFSVSFYNARETAPAR